VLDRTRRLWEKQRQLVGDRRGLFAAVADAVDVKTVLYPGSYVDITPSMIWPSVTYVDIDRRANQFFADEPGVQELLVESGIGAGRHHVRFIHADYSRDLPLDEDSSDLLVSLYAGFVSEHCTKYLRRGRFLLVNPSHGDAAMASIDHRYRFHGAVVFEAERWRIATADHHAYHEPRRDVDITIEYPHETGRGVAYTTSPFAYLNQRVS
jgi:hypothetical protein